jgi:hypothetical protein
MVHASTQQLIRKLYELTDAGMLAWQEGERETSRLETEGYVVELEPAPPQVRLLRADGRELERAEPDDLAAIAWPDGEGTFASRVAEMATRAGRYARRAEQANPTPLSAISTPPRDPPPPRPKLASFGKTQSFVKQPVAPRIPMMTSLSARSVQTPELASPIAAYQRNATAGAAMLHRQPEPDAKAPGPHIYKPWK